MSDCAQPKEGMRWPVGWPRIWPGSDVPAYYKDEPIPLKVVPQIEAERRIKELQDRIHELKQPGLDKSVNL